MIFAVVPDAPESVCVPDELLFKLTVVKVAVVALLVKFDNKL